MSAHQSLFPLAATAVTGFVVVTALVFAPDLAGASEQPTAKQKTVEQKGQTKPALPQVAGGKPSTKPADGASAAARPQSQPSAPGAPAITPKAPEQRGAACTCPSENRVSPWPRPKYAEMRQDLDEGDEIAALESLQLALSEVGDGATYVWHRGNGRLSGVVQPTASFKDGSGKVCRHVQLMLTSGAVSKKTEGIACRLEGGLWQLEG